MAATSAAGKLQIDYMNLPPATQFNLQQTVAKSQKGTVIKLPDGRDVDARDVKMGVEGRRTIV